MIARTNRTSNRDEAARVEPTAIYRRLNELDVWRRLDRIIKIGPSGRSAIFITRNSEALLEQLLVTRRFCADTRAGRILHPGTRSIRELSNRESLHLAFHGDYVRAHLDRFSPLVGRSGKAACRYSPPRIAAHVLGRLGAKLVRGLEGGWVELDMECHRLRQETGSGEAL